MSAVHCRIQKVGEVEVFYREPGPIDAPVILLLHGFPTSSHMFRDLIPALADRYRVIAPDLPGFGLTRVPPRGQFTCSFYVDGFSKDWEPWQTYWRDPTPEHREATGVSLTGEAIRFQHEHGAPAGSVSPDAYMLDTFYMHRPEAQEIQLDLILSYRTNVALYPDFQSYLRTHRPPVLVVWGKHDVFFLPPGAEAYKRDVPDAEIHLLDAGHFALEAHHREIAARIRDFLGRKLAAR